MQQEAPCESKTMCCAQMVALKCDEKEETPCGRQAMCWWLIRFVNKVGKGQSIAPRVWWGLVLMKVFPSWARCRCVKEPIGKTRRYLKAIAVELVLYLWGAALVILPQKATWRHHTTLSWKAPVSFCHTAGGPHNTSLLGTKRGAMGESWCPWTLHCAGHRLHSGTNQLLWVPHAIMKTYAGQGGYVVQFVQLACLVNLTLSL